MFALFSYSRQVLRAHHQSPYVRIIVLVAAIHLLVFVFSPPFQVKPYHLDAEAKPPIEVTDIDDISIQPPPADVPLPPSAVIPVDVGGDDNTLPPTLYDDPNDIPALNLPDVKEPPKFYPFDEPPVLIVFKAPVYPKLSREAGIQGDVKLKVLVGRDGLVEEVSILESNVTEEMDQAAMKAARECRFKPGRQQTKPVPVQVVIPFSFRLDDCK
jgi:protein TonB